MLKNPPQENKLHKPLRKKDERQQQTTGYDTRTSDKIVLNWPVKEAKEPHLLRDTGRQRAAPWCVHIRAPETINNDTKIKIKEEIEQEVEVVFG